MKDALERRALLLHLGCALQLLTRVFESRTTAATVGELIALNPLLENEHLLEHVLPSLSVDDFVAQALQAFCTWPQRLLDETLDHDALATSVRNHLFELNPGGWHAYAADLRGEVAWFGRKQTARRRSQHREPGRASAPGQADATVSAAAIPPVTAQDIERDEGMVERISESIEGLAPPNTTERGNEQSLPEFE
ncbi:hypothetical protein [Paraburkholderia heleia]|uniref:hypothetical protein n=1 Tax=Paraburkholderia heleia TaxID=634127 RepID=UPI0031D0AC6D